MIPVGFLRLPSASVKPPPRLSPEILLFAALVVLHLVPLWAFPFFPSQDGADHQAVAHVLREYDDPGASLLRQYYRLNRESLPNRFVYFLLADVFAGLPVPLAEKLLLSLYVVLLPVAIRYAVRGVDPGAGSLSVLAFPFLYNFPFHMGFYNFCFSLVAFFFALGWWLRRQGRMGPPAVAMLAVLALWVYFAHPVSFVLAFVAILTLAGWGMLLEWRETGLWRGLRAWVLPPFLAFLPALVLMATFVGQRLDRQVAGLSLWVRIKHLASLYSLVSMDRRVVVFSTAFAALLAAFAVACVLRRRGREPRDGLLLVALVFTLIYFVAPNDLSGGGFIVHRINLYVFLALLPWLAGFPLGRRERLLLQAGAVAVSLGILGLLWPRYAQVNDGLKEVVAAGEHIPRDTTVLALSYAPFGLAPDGGPLVFRLRPFLHPVGHIAARKRIVDLSLYPADEDYFPIFFTPALNPYDRIGIRDGMEADPPRVDFLGYPERTGGRVDYVLTWRLDAARRDDPWVRSALRQLAEGYEPVYTSPRGWVEVWRSRDFTRPASARPTASWPAAFQWPSPG